MSIPNVRLHMLNAGHMTSAKAGFLAGTEGNITFPVPIYVIEHPDGLVVIDTGLHPELTKTKTRLRALADMFEIHADDQGADVAGAVLTKAGFDPAQVTHVILTHLHFDHGGGLCELPNASVLVQQREWAMLKDEQQVALGSYNPDDVDLGHHRVELDGDHDVFGDHTVTCLLTDGHTAGHQSVQVRTESGTYIVCGDCCYVRKSLDDEHLPGFSFDADRQLQSIRRLKQLQQSEKAILLFGHDPEQWATVEREGLHANV